MKRIYILVLSALLACLLVLPVSASSSLYSYNGIVLPSIYFDESFDNYYIVKQGDTFILALTEYPLYFSENNLYVDTEYETYFFSQYQYIDGGWSPIKLSSVAYSFLAFYSLNNTELIWSSHDINSIDGDVFFEYVTPELDTSHCDGSSCPANDADHNNICDDCGNLLTYNLRSTLLDFTKNLAESYSSGYPYYAIMQHPIDSDKYNLYLSKTPMTSPDYQNIVGSSMQFTNTFTEEDGSFSNRVFVSVETFGGSLVYANHEIENFQAPPLAVIIQGVTGEALEVELPNLMMKIRTIVVLAVGCLALLILSIVLVRVLRRFSHS